MSKSIQKNQQQNNLIKQNQFISSTFIGPIPPASELIKYNQATPDAGNRILKLAENQQSHRIEIEKFVITGQQKRSDRGQYFAFSIALLGLLLGFYAIITDKSIAGSIFSGVSFLFLVSMFLTGKQKIKKNLEEKKID